MRVALTGALSQKRAVVIKQLNRHGVLVDSSVTAKTDYLIRGRCLHEFTGKVLDAMKYKVPIVGEAAIESICCEMLERAR